MKKLLTFILLMCIAAVAHGQYGNRQLINCRTADYDTVKSVPRPSAKEIAQHEKEEQDRFLTFVSEEKKEMLPMEMETRRKPASWQIPFTNLRGESRLRYLTGGDVLAVVGVIVIASFIMLYMMQRDVYNNGKADGYREATYDRTMKACKLEQLDKKNSYVVYVGCSDLDTIEGKKSLL